VLEDDETVVVVAEKLNLCYRDNIINGLRNINNMPPVDFREHIAS